MATVVLKRCQGNMWLPHTSSSLGLWHKAYWVHEFIPSAASAEIQVPQTRIQSSTVQIHQACVHCSLGFLFLAERSGVWCRPSDSPCCSIIYLLIIWAFCQLQPVTEIKLFLTSTLTGAHPDLNNLNLFFFFRWQQWWGPELCGQKGQERHPSQPHDSDGTITLQMVIC